MYYRYIAHSCIYSVALESESQFRESVSVSLYPHEGCVSNCVFNVQLIKYINEFDINLHPVEYVYICKTQKMIFD
jgi:hypothetical protein